MEDKQLLQYLVDIKSDVSGIKQHLKDMNGKLIKLEEFRTKDCPLNQEKMSEKITEIRMEMVKVTAIMGIIVTIIVTIATSMINHFMFN